jgi:thioredoxin reductase
VVLEQATLAASIKSFPRDKIVYDPPLTMPVEGPLWLREASKDELVAQWSRIVRMHAVDVREGRRVVDVARDGDGFVVDAEVGADEDRVREVFRASRVVLAIGKRGTPRMLEADIDLAAESNVSYALADARSLAGKRVLVVGLGDAAMEAAVALARQPGTIVTIAHRGEGFRRGRARSIAELQRCMNAGSVRVLFRTQVKRVRVGSVVLETTPEDAIGPAASTRTVPNDAVVVLIGGVPSWELLTRAGIRVARFDRRPAHGGGAETAETAETAESPNATRTSDDLGSDLSTALRVDEGRNGDPP